MTQNATYIDVSEENGWALMMRDIQGPVVMLNLLRYKDVADYSDFPELAPADPISGEAAYRIYMQHATPFIVEAGSKVLLQAKGGQCLIGPTDEHWDLVLVVEHPSVEAFMAFAQNEGYLAGMGHRTAALADSRLLPMEK